MITQIIAELEKMDKKLAQLRRHIDQLRANDSRTDDKRIAYLEGEYEGITRSHLQFKRLIDQTPEGIAWERGQGEK